MSAEVLTPSALRAAAEKLPRVRLAHLPTPLEEVPRFAAKLGGGVRVFVKRDDCTGLVLGGNKARHNEFLLADAIAEGCDLFIWGALVQSNNCRQTAAACARLGIECRLYLSRAHLKTEPQGNLLIDYLVGAHVEFTDAKIGPELNALLASKAEEFRRRGRRPYFWNPPRVVPLAAVSYALCMAEIAEQLAELGLKPDAFYVSSAGATGAGVTLGKKLLGLTCPTRLICPMQWPWHIPTRIADDANAAAERLVLPHRITPAEIAEQLAALGLKPDALYVSSAGATGAGVTLGKKLLGLMCPARLICPMHWPWHIPTRIADDANAAAERLVLPHRITPAEIDADESYVAPGYGLPSQAGRDAMHLLARTEAILTDHVYTAKALAALMADVRAGKY
ncbi:MAG TPA: pyridoxal-phosphate dependent enzyme, partial [Gemmata sp.]|nr:pyridoxal-phosphate dependent enzyme [Gemmata sp.]